MAQQCGRLLERALSALPVIDVDAHRDVTLSHETATLAALGGVRSSDIAIPAALVADIGRALTVGRK